ncbi:hypothetical protein JCM19237_6857 [Photobacterium aphoticum]|uniref:Uncharacterized protein n=1 Tax=Photobacterium aphoticum TaxID=754436 RepID=A0A090QY31_9GAMM|nr:hypothetical protein JCM19237_6857 [Photobacterium aphoticum]
MPYLAQDKLMTPQHLERLPRVLGESSARDYMSQGDTVWVDSELEKGSECGFTVRTWCLSVIWKRAKAAK